MKKRWMIWLAVSVMLGASACAAETLRASTAGAIAPEQALEAPAVLDFENACSQADAALLLRAFGPLAAYLSISVYEIDLARPEPEDFWLILSLVTYGARPESVGEFGTIDLSEAEVEDIARTIFPEYMENNSLPPTEQAYAGEFVAAEGLYELQPMEIGSMEYVLESLGPDREGEGSFQMGIRLKDPQKRTEKLDWVVSLSPWSDREDHIFPCQLSGIRQALTSSPAPAGL